MLVCIFIFLFAQRMCTRSEKTKNNWRNWGTWACWILGGLVMGSRFLNLCSAFQFFFDVLMDSKKKNCSNRFVFVMLLPFWLLWHSLVTGSWDWRLGIDGFMNNRPNLVVVLMIFVKSFPVLDTLHHWQFSSDRSGPYIFGCSLFTLSWPLVRPRRSCVRCSLKQPVA
jgi:hypothetical protein